MHNRYYGSKQDGCGPYPQYKHRPALIARAVRAHCLILRWESYHQSASHYILTMEEDPASFYRMVVRVTGVPWTGVRALDSDWVVHQLTELFENRASIANMRGTNPLVRSRVPS